MLVLLIAVSGLFAGGRATCCADEYWTGQCTLCPGSWYKSCRSGYSQNNQKGCGFLSAGCEIKCRNSCKSRDEGCGCGKGTACLRCKAATLNTASFYKACPEVANGGTCTVPCRSEYTGTPATVKCNRGTWSSNRPSCTRKPIHCEWGTWSKWSDCSKTCSHGVKTRTRTPTRNGAHGGDVCLDSDSFEEVYCSGEADKHQPCPVDCVVSDWTEFSACSKDCGTGSQKRTRAVQISAQADGKACPALEESRECNKQICIEPCKTSEWTEWNTCSEPCGDGMQVRSREILQYPSEGAEKCPGLTEARKCNIKECPKDCVMGEWSAWSECTRNCGGGFKKRTRDVTQDADEDGVQCGLKEETMDCNMEECKDGEDSGDKDSDDGRSDDDCKDPISSLEMYEDFCAAIKEEKVCKRSGCEFKKDACGPAKKKKFKCKKIKESPEACNCIGPCKAEFAEKNGKQKFKKCNGTFKWNKI